MLASQEAQGAGHDLMNAPALPAEGFVRLPTVLAVYPVSRSHWWQGIKDGRYPKPYALGPQLRGWKVEDIRELIGSAKVSEAA